MFDRFSSRLKPAPVADQGAGQQPACRPTASPAAPAGGRSNIQQAAGQHPTHSSAPSVAQAKPRFGQGARQMNRGPVIDNSVDLSPEKLAEYRVLSDSGDYAADENQKKLLCLLNNHVLVVAHGHDKSHFVQAYMAMLSRRGYQYSIKCVQMREIANIYAQCIPASGRVSQDTNALQIAKQLLADGTKARASDIHLHITWRGTEVEYRVHGDLKLVRSESQEWGMMVARTLYQVMADVSSEEAFKETERMDARIGKREYLPEQLHGIRIATTPTDAGTLMVLRLLHSDSIAGINLETLGFASEQAAMINFMLSQANGINIVSGPTGSGKSTTLKRILEISHRDSKGTKRIITVEDPPEYDIEGAIQTPVMAGVDEDERKRRFTEAISNTLRLDPDLLMIGEMRSRAAADLAFEGALTGHQVWTTLHANNALAILDRLTEMGVSRGLITSPGLITGLTAQRLVKQLCPHCRVPIHKCLDKLPHGFYDRLTLALPIGHDTAFMPGPGCAHCDHGVTGRTLVAEVITPDPEFMSFIADGKPHLARHYWVQERGGMTMTAHALRKIAAGVIDPLSAERQLGPLDMDLMLLDNKLTKEEVIRHHAPT